MNAATVAIIKATIPVLREHGVAITERMYARMFAAHPEIRRMFNPSHMRPGGQASTLAMSILAYAEHIENPQVLRDAIERIAHRHVSLQVQAEQYAIVGEHLIGAIGDVLGEAATPDIVAAWTEAYGILAGVLTGREGDLYAHQAELEGGWADFRRFRVVAVRDEGLRAKGFELAPVDGGVLPRYAPGQHVSVRLPGHEQLALRQYSLCTRPGQDTWQLVVQHEGVLSELLHALGEGDEVELAAPCGEFTLELAPEGPLALIAGGVGITPLAGMLDALVRTQPTREVVLVHAVRTAGDRPLAKQLDALAAEHAQLRVVVRCEDVDGRLDQQQLAELVPAGATCLFCGPTGFMHAIDGWLAALGVPDERRHYECFGPRDAVAGEARQDAA